MGLRFQRRIRIAPGIRLNVGLTGASLSVGPRGASMTLGRNGVYGNVGVPGSGLSYRTRLDGGSSRSAGTRPTPAPAQPVSVRISLDDDGKLLFTDTDGRAVSAAAERQARKQAGDQISTLVEQACARANEELEQLPNIHLLTPAPGSRPLLDARSFDEPEPEPPTPLVYSLLGRFFSSHRDRIDRENQRLRDEHAQALLERQARMKAFLSQERSRADRYSSAGRSGATSTDVETFLEHHLAEIAWPRETFIDFQATPDGRCLYLNVDLPEVEEMPSREARPHQRAGVQFTERSATAIRQTYARHIHGIAFRLVGEVFAWLPGVQTVVFSGYSQRLDASTGIRADEYLLSVCVARPAWQQLNFGNLEAVDPIEALARFDLRRVMTKTGIFKAVEPIPA